MPMTPVHPLRLGTRDADREALAEAKEIEARLKKRRALTRVELHNGYALTNHPERFQEL